MQSTHVIPSDDPGAISQAITTLNQGGLIAFPTDTVYGLACRIDDTTAIERIYQAKERSQSKAIAVLIADETQISLLTSDLPASGAKLAQRFWPGALTLIVQKRSGLPENLSPYPTIGVRIPDHPFARALLRQTGPLAVTSANLSGGLDSQNAEDVQNQLTGRVDLILDGGATPGGVPSTVVDCTKEPPVVLRTGAISSDDIFNALK